MICVMKMDEELLLRSPSQLLLIPLTTAPVPQTVTDLRAKLTSQQKFADPGDDSTANAIFINMPIVRTYCRHLPHSSAEKIRAPRLLYARFVSQNKSSITRRTNAPVEPTSTDDNLINVNTTMNLTLPPRPRNYVRRPRHSRPPAPFYYV